MRGCIIGKLPHPVKPSRGESINLMWSFRNWRRARVLKRTQLNDGRWQRALAHVPLTRGFSADELRRLRELVILFLHEKTIETAGGVNLDEAMRLIIAIQACVPILNLGLDYYAGWYAVIVYPQQFRPQHEFVDEANVVHVDDDWKMGESWEHGPVILSWEDVKNSGTGDGFNLVIHEFAHKLDMLNGAPNGAPPLHANMRLEVWLHVFTHAYADFCARVERGEDTGIDPYASESPAEFFAVLSEVFFEVPLTVQQCYPQVYQQLVLFYRQDPLSRLGAYLSTPAPRAP